MESNFLNFYPFLLVKSIFISIGKHFLSVFIYFCQWNSYFQQMKSIFFFILFFFANYCQRKAFYIYWKASSFALIYSCLWKLFLCQIDIFFSFFIYSYWWSSYFMKVKSIFFILLPIPARGNNFHIYWKASSFSLLYSCLWEPFLCQIDITFFFIFHLFWLMEAMFLSSEASVFFPFLFTPSCGDKFSC